MKVLVQRTSDYLEHHGINGQKWGKRNGPPYPLDYDDHTAEQKRENKKSVIGNYENHNEKDTSSSQSDSVKKSSSTQEKSENKVVERSSSTGQVKTDFSSIKETDNDKSTAKTEKEKQSEKTEKDRQSLHDRRKAALLEKGLTEEQAEAQIKFENRAMAIAAATAVALGVGVTYGLVRQHNMDTDFTLKGGTNMFRVSTSGEASVQDMFYATTNKADSKKYAGMYAKQLNGELLGAPNGKDVYQKMLSPKSDIRIAGAKTGKEVYEQLYSTDAAFKKAHFGMSYDMFNKEAIMTNKNSGETKKFFDALQEKGYGGVIDINDSKYSGYEANRPVILFNQKSNINVDSVSKLSKEAIDANYNFALKRTAGQAFLADKGTYNMTVARLSVGALTMAGSKYVKSLNMDEIEVPAEQQKNKKIA